MGIRAAVARGPHRVGPSNAASDSKIMPLKKCITDIHITHGNSCLSCNAQGWEGGKFKQALEIHKK